ncbi:response regulator [Pseudomonas sp. TE3610]
MLIVDNNALAGVILTRNLEGLGWQAARVTDCAQVAAHSFDVLVIDWQTVANQTAETLTSLQDVRHRVLLVTAFTRDAATHALQAAGLPPPLLLTKPLTPRQLARHLVDLHPAAGPAPVKPASKPGRPKRLAGLRLLLVEDNAVNQMVAAGLLKAEGASVDLADCGMAGVERAVQAQPPYDLVLMDLRMPDIDGQEATRRIRQAISAEQLPIIAMTANVSEQDREQCLAAGMNEHVGKPINLERLVAVIQQFR